VNETARVVMEYTLVGMIGVMAVWFIFSMIKDVLEQLGKR
jgi:hypothetical protein